MNATRFAVAGAVVAAVAPLVTFAGVVVLPAPTAFRGDISAPALVVLVFTVDDLRSVRATGVPAFASAVVATVLGLWLAVAPVVYDAGFVPYRPRAVRRTPDRRVRRTRRPRRGRGDGDRRRANGRRVSARAATR